MLCHIILSCRIVSRRAVLYRASTFSHVWWRRRLLCDKSDATKALTKDLVIGEVPAFVTWKNAGASTPPLLTSTWAHFETETLQHPTYHNNVPQNVLT